MLERLNNSYKLMPYTARYAPDAFRLLLRWLECQGDGDIASIFNSTTRLAKYCRVAVKGNEVYALIYPDFDFFISGEYIRIHCVISAKGCMCKQAQVALFKEYLNFLFSEGFKKVAAEFPEICRLNRKLVEEVGFTLEGFKRREFRLKNKLYGVYYYGLLKEEWENTHE